MSEDLKYPYQTQLTILATEIVDLVSENLDIVKLPPIEGEILQFGIRLKPDNPMKVVNHVRESLNKMIQSLATEDYIKLSKELEQHAPLGYISNTDIHRIVKDYYASKGITVLTK